MESLRVYLSSVVHENVASVKDRLQTAVQSAVADIAGHGNTNSEYMRGNIMLVLIAKREDEKDYEFSDDTADQRSSRQDMRAVIYKIMRNLQATNIR